VASVLTNEEGWYEVYEAVSVYARLQTIWSHFVAYTGVRGLHSVVVEYLTVELQQDRNNLL
jgi:hypothetical protein